MLKSNEHDEDVKESNQEEDLDRPLYLLVVLRISALVQEILGYYKEALLKIWSSSQKYAMSYGRRQRSCDEMGPVHLLRSMKDQIQKFQEKRGFTADENNFVNLCSIVVQQAGQALYTMITMFLALVPGTVILLHACHFLLDRTLDIVTTKSRGDLIYKSTIFTFQLAAVLWALHFLASSIFAPILTLQMDILRRLASLVSPS